MTDLTDAVGNSNESSFLAARSRHERCFPAELEVETRVGAADEEHEAEVASTNVEGSNEHATACCAHDNWDDDVVERFLEAS